MVSLLRLESWGLSGQQGYSRDTTGIQQGYSRDTVITWVETDKEEKEAAPRTEGKLAGINKPFCKIWK